VHCIARFGRAREIPSCVPARFRRIEFGLWWDGTLQRIQSFSKKAEGEGSRRGPIAGKWGALCFLSRRRRFKSSFFFFFQRPGEKKIKIKEDWLFSLLEPWWWQSAPLRERIDPLIRLSICFETTMTLLPLGDQPLGGSISRPSGSILARVRAPSSCAVRYILSSSFFSSFFFGES